MAGSPWRAISTALVLLLLVQFYFMIAAFRPASFSVVHAKAGEMFGFWTYEPSRDSENTALSTAQCSKAFPQLYYEIDRSVSYWNAKDHIINEGNIDISNHSGPAFKVLVHENELRVTGNSRSWLWPFWDERTIDALNQLHRAVLGATCAGETLPTVEFSIVVGDIAALPSDGSIGSFFSFTRKVDDEDKEALWLIPDFNFNASPPNSTTWQRTQRNARQHDSEITKKIPKLAWRGVSDTNAQLRGYLLQHTSGKDWADVQVMNWEDKEKFMDMDDSCRYMFLVHTEGISYSSRLKHLLNCNSVTIVHDLKFVEFFYHLLIPSGPKQNYVAVRRDFWDLGWQIEHFLGDAKSAQQIADNAVATFRDRYTSPAAEACYWRRLIQQYSKVSFSPDPYMDKEVNIDGRQSVKTVLRGDSFEKFTLHLKQDSS